ncbi:LysR family transcriptional regulator [Rhodococcus sp. BH4]|uniref:LysR family transcriptional regulator n=1 Tax=Rhodococcus sp. BH4 TaxID=1807790 RepID=UPI003FA71382
MVAVADHENFTRAALSLRIAHPTLSSSIAKLEKELELQIFVRTPKGADPTSAGTIVVASARGVLRRILELESSVHEIKSVTAGTLRLKPNRTFASLTSNPIYMFQKKYPLVQIDWRSSRSDFEVSNFVGQGRCEIGFCRRPQSSPQLDFHPICQSQLVAIYAANSNFGAVSDPMSRISDPLSRISDPLSWLEVSQLPMIVPPIGSAARSGLERLFTERSLHINVCMKVEHFESHFEMVRIGAQALPSSNVHRSSISTDSRFVPHTLPPLRDRFDSPIRDSTARLQSPSKI